VRCGDVGDRLYVLNARQRETLLKDLEGHEDTDEDEAEDEAEADRAEAEGAPEAGGKEASGDQGGDGHESDVEDQDDYEEEVEDDGDAEPERKVLLSAYRAQHQELLGLVRSAVRNGEHLLVQELGD
jgi:hypothetical protein